MHLNPRFRYLWNARRFLGRQTRCARCVDAASTELIHTLTRRQKEVVDFIATFVDENGYSPSYEEIANALKLASLATVHKHISALQAKNYLKRTHNQSRSVDLAPKYLVERQRMRKEQSLEVPLLGRIAAGAPVESVSERATLSFADFLGHSDTRREPRIERVPLFQNHRCTQQQCPGGAAEIRTWNRHRVRGA